MTDPTRLVLQFSDSHLLNDPAATLHGCHTDEQLRKVVHYAKQLFPEPALILLTGDLCHDAGTAAYARLQQHFASWDCPLLHLAGNHDDPELLKQQLGYARIHELSNWRVIALHTAVAGAVHGELSPEELDWLETALQADADTAVLIAMHHPPIDIGSAWIDASKTHNGPEFCQLVAQYPRVKAVVAGHVHQAFCRRIGTIDFMTAPATCFQFKSGSQKFARDHSAPGFRALWLAPDFNLRSKVIRLDVC